jgi:hypothetical protein
VKYGKIKLNEEEGTMFGLEDQKKKKAEDFTKKTGGRPNSDDQGDLEKRRK